MLQRSSYLSKSFLIWVVANILGISATAALPLLFASLSESLRSGVVSGFIFSFPIGLAQWLALRRISQTSILWVLTVPLGILIYFLINGLIPEGLMQKIDDESIVVLTAAYLMIGFAVGLLQWFIMRRQFSGSLLWILGSTVGVGFSFGLILVTDLINRSGIIALIVGVLVYPITTGLILLLLLAHHKQSDTNMAYQT
jgi:hypothetical protein